MVLREIGIPLILLSWIKKDKNSDPRIKNMETKGSPDEHYMCPQSSLNGHH